MSLRCDGKNHCPPNNEDELDCPKGKFCGKSNLKLMGSYLNNFVFFFSIFDTISTVNSTVKAFNV